MFTDKTTKCCLFVCSLACLFIFISSYPIFSMMKNKTEWFRSVVTLFKYSEKVNFKSQILVHEYWTILDHFGVPVLFASGCHQHVLKNVNITFLGNTGTPEMFRYLPILERSSIWDLKYTFSKYSSKYSITVPSFSMESK